MAFQSQENAVFENYNRRGSSLPWVIAFICAVVGVCSLFLGYYFMRGRYAPPSVQSSVEQTSTPTSQPRAQVIVDEPLLRNSQAVIGGAVRNISNEPMGAIAIIIELTRQGGNDRERRIISLTPSRLAPGEEGRYSLTAPAREWSEMRVVQILDQTSGREIAFNTSLGARRPPQARPTPRPPILLPPTRNNNGFYNTPDNPIVVR
jgi:hypothetical protein